MAVQVAIWKKKIKTWAVMIGLGSCVFYKNGFDHVYHVLADIEDRLSILIDIFPFNHRHGVFGVFFKKLTKHIVTHFVTEILKIIHLDAGR